MFGRRRKLEEAWDEWVRVIELTENSLLQLDKVIADAEAKIAGVDGRLERIETAFASPQARGVGIPDPVRL